MWVYRRRWHTSCSWSSDGFCLGKLTVCEMLPLRTMFRIPACQHQYLACCISAFSIFTAGLFIETKCVMAWLTGCYSSLLLTSSYLGKDNISTSEAQLLLNSQFFPVSLGKKKKNWKPNSHTDYLYRFGAINGFRHSVEYFGMFFIGEESSCINTKK